MLSFLLKVGGLLIVIIILAHAYMFVRYDSFNACTAAANKVQSQVMRQSTVEGMAGAALDGGARLVQRYQQRGKLGCYRVVFLGGR